MYNIDDQILGLYMDEMDDIVNEAFEENNLFLSYILNEAEGDAADNTSATTTVVNKVKTVSADMGNKLKEMLQKLGELLEKFIGALQRVGEIIKTKFANLMKTLEVFKRGGKAKSEFKVIKFDQAYQNANEINEIVKDMDEEVIKPISNNQDPKNDSLDSYTARYDKVKYSEFTKDNNNLTVYREGATINAGVLQNAANKGDGAIKLNAAGVVRTKAIRVISKNMENRTNQEDEAKNIKLFHTAASKCISMNQDINRYMTRYVGDMLSIVNHCEAVKGA